MTPAERKKKLKEIKSWSDSWWLISKAARESWKFLLSEIDRRDEALRRIVCETGLEDPNFGDFAPLALAARLGLIDIKAREALGEE